VPIAPGQFFVILAVASLVLWAEEIRKYLANKARISSGMTVA